MKGIYLDHAATTPLSNEVLQKMLPYFTDVFGNADSPHAAGRRAMSGIDSARDCIAERLHAKPSEIYFTSGGTEADNWALRGCAYAQRELGKNHVILSSIEHHALLSSAKRLEEEGFEVTLLPVDEGGRVALNALKSALKPTTGVVAVMLVNNETGAIQPVKELAQIARENGSVFFTDGVQAAPYLPLNVAELGVDMLSLSAHKFYGPKGAGALYIKSGVKVKGLVIGGEQERGLRGGTLNVPALVGMAAAYERACEEREENNAKIQSLRELFLGELSSVEGLTVRGEGIPALINLQIHGVSGADFIYNMDLRGVRLATGSACASASIKPSHVLTAMGLSEGEAKECVRVSLGKDNEEEEIRRAAAIAKEVIAKLRGEKI